MWTLLLFASSSLLPPTPAALLQRRRELLGAAGSLLGAAAAAPAPALALVKGSAPPPKTGPKERKCKSIDECEALGERERAKAAEGADETIERTRGGDRYRDLAVGQGGKAVAEGDAVEIRYRVMRLGTKARDGLSGEGQTIFSFGYGEDEDREGDTLPVRLAGRNLVAGVNDALVGMKPGGRRRVLVRPERGWRDLTGACAEGTKSLGLDAQKRTDAQSGNLVFKADIGAAIENELACQNKVSLPQPRTYGAKARFGRRFDESLLVELDVVGFADPQKAAGGLDVSSKAFKCQQNPFADGCDDGVPVQ
mmetsp:Transcript_21963/g.70739  ORF Transcript_21963/g.70739 Transcript_21963/m.70739 type:complete len:309 (-) Transcript_21963:1302-2228(-)